MKFGSAEVWPSYTSKISCTADKEMNRLDMDQGLVCVLIQCQSARAANIPVEAESASTLQEANGDKIYNLFLAATKTNFENSKHVSNSPSPISPNAASPSVGTSISGRNNDMLRSTNAGANETTERVQ